MSNITRQQRAALKTNPAVINISASEVEVFIDGGDGRADYDATEAAAAEVTALLGWGGYRSGYGSWVLRAGYTVDAADYCDTAASCHY